VVKPIMERFPQAWTFFIIFIVCTTFMALNLFIGVVVNAIAGRDPAFARRGRGVTCGDQERAGSG